jgi:8-oxo-dGTP pyrophosphatase MutT (NUDIX family)
MSKSNLDLINECDSFPYYQVDPELYLQHTATYYHLRVAEHPETLGFLLPSVANVLRGIPGWSIDDEERTLTLTLGIDPEHRSKAVEQTVVAMRKTSYFEVLNKWRGELYPVYGAGGELLFSIERSASPLFGVVTYGVHLTGYVKSTDENDHSQYKIWVPRRARAKQTYGGMLDNMVAGGIASGEQPFECLIRECEEEASLSEEMVRKGAKAAGTVTYFYIRDERAGGETRLLQPECQYVYDLELPEDIIPKPNDDEVEEFNLWSIQEVKDALARAEFKPNCALVMLDFFVRHGILTYEDPGYTEIIARLHRRLEFPMI